MRAGYQKLWCWRTKSACMHLSARSQAHDLTRRGETWHERPHCEVQRRAQGKETRRTRVRASCEGSSAPASLCIGMGRLASILALRLAGDGDEVDTVAVAAPVRQVVAQVRAVNGHALAILETPHVVPHHLLIPERRPSVRLRLGHELLECPVSRHAAYFVRRRSLEQPSRQAQILMVGKTAGTQRGARTCHAGR